MIPAPDRYRCIEVHPRFPLARCFKTEHSDLEQHHSEMPCPSPTYHATHVVRWYTGAGVNARRSSEFPEGPFIDPSAGLKSVAEPTV